MANRFRARNGLTLMELLLVLAILSLLAAILLPIFSTVKSGMRKTRCQTNLLQFAHAFRMYAEDWAGPWPAPGGRRGEWNYWDPRLEVYLPGERTMDSVWCCPTLTKWKCQWPPRSYTMNSYLRTPWDVDPWTKCIYIQNGIKPKQIPFPKETILLFEGHGDWGRNDVYRCGNWEVARGWPPNKVGPAHSGKDNFLFCDGHVQLLTIWETLEPENLWYIRRFRPGLGD